MELPFTLTHPKPPETPPPSRPASVAQENPDAPIDTNLIQLDTKWIFNLFLFSQLLFWIYAALEIYWKSLQIDIFHSIYLFILILTIYWILFFFSVEMAWLLIETMTLSLKILPVSVWKVMKEMTLKLDSTNGTCHHCSFHSNSWEKSPQLLLCYAGYWFHASSSNWKALKFLDQYRLWTFVQMTRIQTFSSQTSPPAYLS